MSDKRSNQPVPPKRTLPVASLPPGKRRRTNDEDDWDDDLEFTQTVQSVLHEIDMLSSQVPVPQRNSPHTSEQPGVDTKFLRPTTSREIPSADVDETLKDIDVEKKQLKEELDIKTGEIAMLRQSLLAKDAENASLRRERNDQRDAFHREQSSREKSLAGDVARLNTKLRFGEEELLRLRGKCKEMSESRNKATTENVRTVTQKGSGLDIKKTKVDESVGMVSIASPKKQSAFPSLHGFSASLEGPHQKQGCDKSVSTDPVQDERGSRRPRRRVLAPFGRLSGPRVVSLLLQDRVELSGETTVQRGIIDLFQQVPCTPVNFQAVKIRRNEDGVLLSPKTSRLKSLSDVSNIYASNSNCQNYPTSTNNLSAALDALRKLLQESPTELTRSARDDSTVPSRRFTPAVEILPLLSEYLSRYIAVTSSSPPSPSPVKSGRAYDSSSSGSSLDSVTSSLQSLFLKGAAFVQNLEKSALTATRILEKLLVHRAEVVRAILGEDRGVVRNLLGIADPTSTQAASTALAEASLGVLGVICDVCPTDLHGSLSCLLQGDTLLHCVQSVTAPGVFRKALGLLTAVLARLPSLPPLCGNNKDECIFRNIYKSYMNHFLRPAKVNQQDETFICSLLYEVVICVTTVLSHHANGAQYLLDNYCPCSSQLVPCLVLVLHESYSSRRRRDTGSTRDLVRACLSTLHSVYLADGSFTIHAASVRHELTAVLMQLEGSFRDGAQHELAAVQDLLDHDRVDSSQESPTDTL